MKVSLIWDTCLHIPCNPNTSSHARGYDISGLLSCITNSPCVIIISVGNYYHAWLNSSVARADSVCVVTIDRQVLLDPAWASCVVIQAWPSTHKTRFCKHSPGRQQVRERHGRRHRKEVNIINYLKCWMHQWLFCICVCVGWLISKGLGVSRVW